MEIPKEELEQIYKDFDAIQCPRRPYVLDALVVNARFTPEMKWSQMVLEMQIAYNNLRTAVANRDLKKLELKRMHGLTKKNRLNRDIKRVELEQLEFAMVGALREFNALYAMWKENKNHYTNDDINAAQPLEYKLKLETQALQDMNATGRIAQGNQEGLRQIGIPVNPQLDNVQSTEERYLAEGKQRLLIVVPTEFKDGKLECLNGLEMPSGVEIKTLNVFGRKVADAYNYAFQEAFNDNADWLLTVEDDNFPPSDAIVKLMELAKQNPDAAVGGYYVKKEKARQCVHIAIEDGVRQPLTQKKGIAEVKTLAMGCTLYRVKHLAQIPYPQCVTTAHLSQDSFLSQQLRDRGVRLLVDCDLKVGHRDRETKKMYY